MNLYLIQRSTVSGYDTFDSAVVAANSEDDARKIHPSNFVTHVNGKTRMGTYSGGRNKGEAYENDTDSWVRFSDIADINVKYLGETNLSEGLVLASFNAG